MPQSITAYLLKYDIYNFLEEGTESLGSALMFVSKEGVTKVAPNLLASLATYKHIPAGFMINLLSFKCALL